MKLTQLNEGKYFNHIRKETGLTEEILNEIWDECVLNCEKTSDKDKSHRGFWKEVKSLFETKIREIDLLEAKSIMEDREAARKSIESILDNLARDDYTSAQQNLRDGLGKSLQSMINTRAKTYLKNKGSEVKERAKEV